MKTLREFLTEKGHQEVQSMNGNTGEFLVKIDEIQEYADLWHEHQMGRSKPNPYLRERDSGICQSCGSPERNCIC